MNKLKYSFFDVDETILNFKSMLKFHKYWVFKTSQFGKLGGYVNYLSSLIKIKYLNNRFSREQINREYYMRYAGIDENQLKQHADLWWKHLLNTKDIFHHRVLEHFFRHQRNGVKMVLVSGSMGQCLEPLKEYLNADYALWTDLEVKDGKLTGQILGQPNIGEEKKRKILKFLKLHSNNEDLLNSYAYGDHVSDIPMLSLVGNPFMVINGIPKTFLLYK